MATDRDNGGKFLPGNSGRRVGARNKLQAAFVEAMQADFEEHGADTIKIVRTERPGDYLKILAGILPKEMLLPDDVLDDMTDAELREAITMLRKMRPAA